MKNRFFATLSSLTLLTAAAASAQSSNEVMRANIPFEFRVGEKVLPAGQYDIRLDVSQGLVTFLGRHDGAMILTLGVEAAKAPEQGTLVFNQYGHTYFLSKVSPAGYTKGRLLSKPKAELEMARDVTPVQPAQVALYRR